MNECRPLIGGDWRLCEFAAAAQHCRGALASLSRRTPHAPPPPPGVTAAVRTELGNALLAEGLLRAELASTAGGAAAAAAAAVGRCRLTLSEPVLKAPMV